jgi:8-oxo-dGTP pyrophosphatase MutT (NUDIX family)
MRTLQKVTAFITRRGAAGPELLLFGHPSAGIQLPSGTVEWHETVEAALLREVQEETGLTEVEVISRLAVLPYTLPDNQWVVLRLTKVFDEPASDASSAGHGLGRGSIVRLDGRAGTFSAVTYEELDSNHEPPLATGRFSGYVRSSLLTNQLERHCFHLTCGQETPDTWPIWTDGHTFQLFWVPLLPRPELQPVQAAWLEAVYSDLLASAQAHH